MATVTDSATPEILVQYHSHERTLELSIPLPRAMAHPRAHVDSIYFFQTALYSAYRAYEAEGQEFPRFGVRIDVDELRARATCEALKVMLLSLIDKLRTDPSGTKLQETTSRRRKVASP